MGGHLLVVGHQYHGMAHGVQLLEDGHHLLTTAAIQSTGGLVRQDHLAAVHQGPGNTHPLLLTTGELSRPMALAIGQSQPGQQGTGPLRPRLLVQTGIDGRDLHIGQGIQMGQQMVALEDETEVVTAQRRQLVIAQLSGGTAGDAVIPPGRSVETT